MRDISRRLQRYQLERYRPPQSPWRRRLRWLPIVAAAWLLYASFLSEHSLFRIWQLHDQNGRARLELAAMNREIERLDGEIKDPARRRAVFEHHLREQIGMARPGEIIYRIQPDSAR